jgi:hypothetical protein
MILQQHTIEQMSLERQRLPNPVASRYSCKCISRGGHCVPTEVDIASICEGAFTVGSREVLAMDEMMELGGNLAVAPKEGSAPDEEKAPGGPSGWC